MAMLRRGGSEEARKKSTEQWVRDAVPTAVQQPSLRRIEGGNANVRARDRSKTDKELCPCSCVSQSAARLLETRRRATAADGH